MFRTFMIVIVSTGCRTLHSMWSTIADSEVPSKPKRPYDRETSTFTCILILQAVEPGDGEWKVDAKPARIGQDD
jgi:hypothetical protein